MTAMSLMMMTSKITLPTTAIATRYSTRYSNFLLLLDSNSTRSQKPLLAGAWSWPTGNTCSGPSWRRTSTVGRVELTRTGQLQPHPGPGSQTEKKPQGRDGREKSYEKTEPYRWGNRQQRVQDKVQVWNTRDQYFSAQNIRLFKHRSQKPNWYRAPNSGHPLPDATKYHRIQIGQALFRMSIDM